MTQNAIRNAEDKRQAKTKKKRSKYTNEREKVRELGWFPGSLSASYTGRMALSASSSEIKRIRERHDKSDDGVVEMIRRQFGFGVPSKGQSGWQLSVRWHLGSLLHDEGGT